MFGIGLGEIFLVILVVFLISPKSLLGIMQKIGYIYGSMEKTARELEEMKKDVKDILKEGSEIMSKEDFNDTAKSSPSEKKQKTAAINKLSKHRGF